jgi:tetratricopeptide (TPR) repeat protein
MTATRPNRLTQLVVFRNRCSRICEGSVDVRKYRKNTRRSLGTISHHIELMGFSDWFRRRGTSSPPEDLLAALIDRFEREDYDSLVRLINQNSAAIRERFPSRKKVPEGIRNDSVAVDRYARTLLWVSTVFERSGDPSLMGLLTGSPGQNPIVQWQEEVKRAESLVDQGHAPEAIAILRATLDNMRGVTGTAVDSLRPRVLGRLGIALAKSGNRTEAISVTREALELCRQAGDDEGVQAYSTNLDAFGTYEMPFDEDAQGRVTVSFTDSGGRTLAPEDLPKAVGSISWRVHYGGPVNPDAKRLHDEGRAAGARGDHDAAVSLLTQAAEFDAAWPYPIYDRAFAHLLKEDFEAALADYRKTLELSPRGFYTAAQAVDILTREATGELPRGLYSAFVMLEHFPEEQRRSILEQLVEKSPTCAPAWDAYVNFIDDPSAQLAAIENGLAARPDADTRGSLIVRKALALWKLGQTDRALDILRPLTASVGDSLSAHAKAYLALAVIGRHQGG